MLRNRHDSWLSFCEKHRGLLTETGLPAAVSRSEQRFRDLLAEGAADASGARVSLAGLAPAAWAALYAFAAVFFRECESFAPEDLFPAFRDEARRRGDPFPR